MLAEVPCPARVAGSAFVYILKSEDGTFYVGHSRDVSERLRKHRLGLGSKHTRDHPVLRLVYVEGPMPPIEAARRERQIKRWTRAKKLALISGDFAALTQLSRRRE